MEYRDVKILDFRCHYFGDCIEVFIEGGDEYIFKLSLKQCFDVSYNNLDTINSNVDVKNINGKQLGYFAQNITVEESEHYSFYKVSLDLPMLFCIANCKDIVINRKKKIMIYFIFDHEKNKGITM